MRAGDLAADHRGSADRRGGCLLPAGLRFHAAAAGRRGETPQGSRPPADGRSSDRPGGWFPRRPRRRDHRPTRGRALRRGDLWDRPVGDDDDPHLSGSPAARHPAWCSPRHRRRPADRMAGPDSPYRAGPGGGRGRIPAAHRLAADAPPRPPSRVGTGHRGCPRGDAEPRHHVRRRHRHRERRQRPAGPGSGHRPGPRRLRHGTSRPRALTRHGGGRLLGHRPRVGRLQHSHRASRPGHRPPTPTCRACRHC